MYERSAIVLERYFENLLRYRVEGNIRDNFNNYCELVEKLEKYQINYQKEVVATEECEECLKQIKLIQTSQKKLYEKSVKLEYNRNLLFSNIEGNVTDIKRCIEKIESDVEKNNKAMLEAKEKFIATVIAYNEKSFELSKCKRYKKMAENAYNDAYENAINNYEAITQEALEIAKAFEKFEDAEDIIAELQNNGKNEKIPFNEEVIEKITIFGIEMAKKEVAGYLALYDKMTKLLDDIEVGATKIELHKKNVRNEIAKMDFIYTVKEYMAQFLDYERMTIIHGRKSHNRLMSEACTNFSADTVQINNLYELLIKEITGKATKKLYKELYTKSYTVDIQEKEEKFKKEKNRINLNTATLINSNYWRIEGIREIYTIFYKTVSEALGKNVDEFEILNNEKENYQEKEESSKMESNLEEKTIEKIPFEIEEKTKKKNKKVVKEKKEEVQSAKDEELHINNKRKEKAKQPKELNTQINSEDEKKYYEDNEKEVEDEIDESIYDTADDIIDNAVENFQNESIEEEFDIFGEKYQNIDFSEKENIKNKKLLKEVSEDSVKDINTIDISYSIDSDDEDDLFTDIKSVIRQKKKKNEIQNVEIQESKPKMILKKVKKISKNKKNTAEGDIW